jgi:hypothetical protein
MALPGIHLSRGLSSGILKPHAVATVSPSYNPFVEGGLEDVVEEGHPAEVSEFNAQFGLRTRLLLTKSAEVKNGITEALHLALLGNKEGTASEYWVNFLMHVLVLK